VKLPRCPHCGGSLPTDPRIDPQVGDVVVRGTLVQEVFEVGGPNPEATERSPVWFRDGYVKARTTDGRAIAATWSLPDWRKDMAKATIGAPKPGPEPAPAVPFDPDDFARRRKEKRVC